ncbi:MAG: flagellar protein FlgN [Lachnospiraceae bacterium]|nr:flagellar protein FlgN [Lachnospiraceae bacterium]
MASLIESIVSVLEQENSAYEKLIAFSDEKTGTIVKGDLENLDRITASEQEVVAGIQKLEKTRIQTMKDIEEVTNHKGEELKLPDLIEMMKNRPAEKEALEKVHVKLKATMAEMKKINDRNRELLENAMEMVRFDMNLLQSLKTAPETADYNSSAYSTGTIMGSGTKRFDTKQ